LATLRSLTNKQKSEVGPKVTAKVRAKRPDDQVALGLCDKVDESSRTLSTAKGRGGTARGERQTKAKVRKLKDTLRDRATLSFHYQVLSWEYRDDMPVEQSAAQTIRSLVLNKGVSFIRDGMEDESTELREILDKRTDEEVADKINPAIETLELGGFLTNIDRRQTEFDQAGTDKDDAHVASKQQTRLRNRAVRRWDKSMSSLINHLDSEYDDESGQAVLDELFQPLAEALKTARLRQTRNASGEIPDEGSEDGDDDEDVEEPIEEPVAEPVADASPPPIDSPPSDATDPEPR
jgi:hypothetical protein